MAADYHLYIPMLDFNGYKPSDTISDLPYEIWCDSMRRLQTQSPGSKIGHTVPSHDVWWEWRRVDSEMMNTQICEYARKRKAELLEKN